jgi:hypothetical protein
MTKATLDALRRELIARGFDHNLEAPKGSIVLSDDYLLTLEIAHLLDILITRREKAWGSVEALGREAAKEIYDDLVCAIEATKAVIGMLSFPGEP